jgi:hypothetical protein
MQAMTMYPYVDREIRRQAAVAERGRDGVLHRARHAEADEHARRQAHRALDQVAIREAQPGDMPALLRLAELDSRPLPAGQLLVAVAGGRITAALSVEDGAVIADPFMATVSFQALLQLRADQISRGRRGLAQRRRGLLGALGLRPRSS